MTRVRRRAWIAGAGASLLAGACAHRSLARYRGRVHAIDLVIDAPYEAVIYVAGQQMLIDNVVTSVNQTTSISAGVAALNLQERTRALAPAARFGVAVGEAARAALPSVGLAQASAEAPADARLAVRIERFGVRAPSEGGAARYSVDLRSRMTLAGGGALIWRSRDELADDVSALAEGAPASVAAIAEISDAALIDLYAALARATGAGLVALVGRAGLSS